MQLLKNKIISIRIPGFQSLGIIASYYKIKIEIYHYLGETFLH